ncbi:MAG TPA: phosphatidylglycerol lysyltransferase domain-containing protein [Gemmatimonadaceae bacterium]
MNLRSLGAFIGLIVAIGAFFLARRIPAVKRIGERGGDRLGPLTPQFFALTTFMGGVLLLWSGSTPAHAGRIGWLTDILPLPIVEFSAYFASIAGVGLIVLARGLQRRLDGAYHATVWLLAAGIVFALGGSLDIEQAISLSIMLVILVPAKRFFYRRSSILEEPFSAGWLFAIALVVVGTIGIAVAEYGSEGLGSDVFWDFGATAQGPRAQRALVLMLIALVAFAVARLLRPVRKRTELATPSDVAAALPIIRASPHSGAHYALLGDKAFLFNEARTAFIMYGIAGQSWVTLGDPVGPVSESVALIAEFIERCDRAGGWPVFYRVSPSLVHLYLDYNLSVVKLGELARVPLQGFSLDGPQRRNLRRVWRKAIDEGCKFEIADPADFDNLLPQLQAISDAWLVEKRAREKGFSLGRFDADFLRHSHIGLVRRGQEIIAFVSLISSCENGEVEADLMRYGSTAPSGIMRYALIEAMFWARDRGYAWFNLGGAPLSGIRASAVTPLWNQIALAARGMGERYYNFQGLRNFKDWFYPEWEPMYLVSPGGTRRTLVLANISSLISAGSSGVFRK